MLGVVCYIMHNLMTTYIIIAVLTTRFSKIAIHASAMLAVVFVVRNADFSIATVRVDFFACAQIKKKPAGGL